MKKLVLLAVLGLATVSASAQGTSRLMNYESKEYKKAAAQAKAVVEAQNRIEQGIKHEQNLISTADRTSADALANIYAVAYNNMTLLIQAYPKQSKALTKIRTLHWDLYNACLEEVPLAAKPIYKKVSTQVGNGKGLYFFPEDINEEDAFAFFKNLHKIQHKLMKEIGKIGAKNSELSASIMSVVNHPYWVDPIVSAKDISYFSLEPIGGGSSK